MTMGGSERRPRTVGRYQIFGEIAAGGMATVHYGRLAGPVGLSGSAEETGAAAAAGALPGDALTAA